MKLLRLLWRWWFGDNGAWFLGPANTQPAERVQQNHRRQFGTRYMKWQCGVCKKPFWNTHKEPTCFRPWCFVKYHWKEV